MRRAIGDCVGNGAVQHVTSSSIGTGRLSANPPWVTGLSRKSPTVVLSDLAKMIGPLTGDAGFHRQGPGLI